MPLFIFFVSLSVLKLNSYFTRLVIGVVVIGNVVVDIVVVGSSVVGLNFYHNDIIMTL